MRLTRYIVAASCVSVGILLWATGNPFLLILGMVFVISQSFILLGQSELSKPIRFKWPDLKPKELFSGLSALLCIAIFVVMLVELGEEKGRHLFTKWYFLGTLWLLYMSMLAARLIEEKMKAQQENA